MGGKRNPFSTPHYRSGLLSACQEPSTSRAAPRGKQAEGTGASPAWEQTREASHNHTRPVQKQPLPSTVREETKRDRRPWTHWNHENCTAKGFSFGSMARSWSTHFSFCACHPNSYQLQVEKLHGLFLLRNRVSCRHKVKMNLDCPWRK